MAKKTKPQKSVPADTSSPNEKQMARLAGVIYQQIAERTGSNNVPLADILIEIRRLSLARQLMFMIMGMSPRNKDAIEVIIGDCSSRSTAEIAYVFGVSESTVINNWIPAGMPVARA